VLLKINALLKEEEDEFGRTRFHKPEGLHLEAEWRATLEYHRGLMTAYTNVKVLIEQETRHITE
jgi:hypothetical protein